MGNSLYDILNSRDDKSLAKSPMSIRLPVHVLARIQALRDLHPSRSQNDLLIELIKGGLDALEASMPPIKYTYNEEAEGEKIKIATGYSADYQRTSNKKYREIEYKSFGRIPASALFDLKDDLRD